MKRLSQLSLITLSMGLVACAAPTPPPPQQVSVPVIVAPVPLITVITDQLVAATTAQVEVAPVFVPRFATEAELKAAEARQKPVARNTRRNSAPATVAAPSATLTPINDTITLSESNRLNVGELDGLLQYLVEKAGNYPPRFAELRERRQAEAETKQMITALDQLVVQPNASFDLLIRAVQLNQVARNLDIGAQSAIKAGVYMRRAIALNPENGSANYWYGTMLIEGGGFKEGIPYLNRAAQAGYKKAYLGLAQAYLSIDQRPNALSALESYSIAVPEQQAAATAMMEEVRAGNSHMSMP